MNIAMRDYHPGQRVVAGRGRSTMLGGGITHQEMRIETVETLDHEAVGRGHNARMTLRHGSELREVLLCNTSIADHQIAASPWTTLWTEPLPESDAAALALVAAVASAPYHRTLLLWIGAAMEDDTAYAHVITDRMRTDVDVEEGCCPTDGMGYFPHPILVKGEFRFEPRSVVAVTLEDATEREGVAMHSVRDARMLFRNVGLEEGAEALPMRTRRGMFDTGNLAGWYEVDENEERAHAMTEPSEALTLCWSDGGDTQIVCLAKTGIDFWRNDDPEAYARDGVPGHGLWMWGNVRYRGYLDHEGGYDADMSGDWTPATELDLERMAGSVDAVRDDVVEYTGEQESDDVVERYMAMARELLANRQVPVAA